MDVKEEVEEEETEEFDPDTRCPYCEQERGEGACFYCQDGF